MAAENSLFELEVPGVDDMGSREKYKYYKPPAGKRKPNFSAQEISIITQKFEQIKLY